MRIELGPLERCGGALSGARAVINASPMGMKAAAPMPAPLLACLATNAPGTVMFDMAYEPPATAFLAHPRDNSGVSVDGLNLMVGTDRATLRLLVEQSAPDRASHQRCGLRPTTET